MASDGETLALLVQKVDTLLDEFRRVNADHEERVRTLERGQAELGSNVARLQERVTLWQVGQTALTAIVGTVATVLGRRP